jgi:NADH:ubiquinone oxidoreductase subunit 3 (subunit A)
METAMYDWIFSPPFAFLVFMLLGLLLYQLGRRLAGAGTPSALKSSLYSSGEANESTSGAPGYRPFFIFALFFAILHLGVLMVGTGGLTWITCLYLVGLLLALVALVLG